MRKERITACLMVQDEQHNMSGALDSVSFCDEVVVVDGGSTDRTVEIARERGAIVIENPWPGFAIQRNVALDAATGDWVFELDADERITPALRASIEALLASPPEAVEIAVCPLRHRFLGDLLGYSAKYPAYRSRLFRRGAYRHDESRGVHEGLEPHERPAVLNGDLEHELANTLGEALRDAWRYATLESRHIRRPANPAAYIKGILLRPAAKVLYRTLVDEGWRDGWRGMLKISLDACSDALVWIRVLLGVTSAGADVQRSPVTDGGGRHFGRRPAGGAKVVALAGRGAAARSARLWLSKLQAQGIDVTLVSDEEQVGGEQSYGEQSNDSCDRIPTRIVGNLRPLVTMRALDVEMQLRTIHAVVPFGRRAKWVWHLLPSTLRPAISGVDAETEPTKAIVQAVDQREPSGSMYRTDR